MKSEGPPQGLHMKETKTKVWWPTVSSDLLENFIATSSATGTEPGISLVGAAFGSPSHIRSHFSKFFSKTKSILLYLKDIDDPQIAFQLQRYCASTCLVARLLRCTPPGLYNNLCPLWTQLPAGLADILGILWLCCSPERLLTQATLPIRHGGLG